LEREHHTISQLLDVVRRLFPRAQAVRALYDFPANETGELAFKKGDLMAVVKPVQRDWWRCSLRGKTGIIPLNYVEKVASPSAEVLKRESKLEETVFSGIKDVERLLFVLNGHIEGTEVSSEEQEVT
jgi:signal transducing adaptor molecule